MWYKVADTILHVDSFDAPLKCLLEDVFRYLGLEIVEKQTRGTQLFLQVDAFLSVPDSAILVEEDRNIEVWRAGSSFWVRGEGGILQLDPEEGRGKGYVDPMLFNADKSLAVE